MSMLSPGAALTASARRRAVLAPASWTRPAPRRRRLHHDTRSSNNEQQHRSLHDASSSSSSSSSTSSPPFAREPAYQTRGHLDAGVASSSSSYPASSSASARRVQHPKAPSSELSQHESSSSSSRVVSAPPPPPPIPLHEMRHPRSIVKDRTPAYRAAMLVEETKELVDSFVTGRLSSERLSPNRAVAELVELLPQCTPCQATLLLISSLTTDDRATNENLAFSRALYQLQAAEYASSPDGVPTATKYLARVVRPSFVDVGSSVAYAALAAEVVQDRRLKASERRSLLVRAMPSLCRLLRELSSTGRGRNTREIRGRHLFEAWRRALESLLHEGVLSPRSQKGDVREASRAASLCAQMLMMAVRWGASSSAVKLAQALNATGSLEQIAASQTVRSANMTAHSRSSVNSRALTDELIEGLIYRGAEGHAGCLFVLLPYSERSLDSYAALLEHYGQAETTKVWYPRSAQSGASPFPSPTPPSMAFQRKLWEEALAKVRQADEAEHAQLLRRLFGARMMSHARHANVELVESDLRAMQAVGLLADGSALSDKAQVGIVQTYVRAGRWEEARHRAVEMLAECRRSAADPADAASHGSALLNTLIAGVVAQDVQLAASAHEKREADHSADEDDDERLNEEVGEHGERGLLDQVLNEVSLPIGTLVQVLRCHDDLVAEMDVKPNAVTRNILLGFLFRWRLAPLGDDISTIRQLLKRCGVFGSKRPAGTAVGKGSDGDAAAAAAVVEEAREFLRHGKSVLKAVVATLFEQGHVEHAHWVLSMLKEGELAAQAELRGAARRTRAVGGKAGVGAGAGASEGV